MSDGIVTIDLGFVNAFLIRAGEGFVLVDTGLASQWAKLKLALAAAGCAPGNLRLVVLTHADLDHAGNARALQVEWGTPVAAHPEDTSSLETGAEPKRAGRGPVAGFLMFLSRTLRRAIGPAGTAPRLKPDLLLEDGADLEAWGLGARVLHLPGHTRGSIAVLTEGGELFAGDVFANRSRPDASPFIENLEAYRESLVKAKALASSVRIVYPGHGRSFPGEAIAGIEL